MMDKITEMDAITRDRNALRHRLSEIEQKLSSSHEFLQALTDQHRQELSALKADRDAYQQTIEALVNSTSWRVTRPLRLVSRIAQGRFGEVRASVRQELRRWGRALYWSLPSGWRDPLLACAYRMAGPLFAGLGHYEIWRQRRAQTMLAGSGSSLPPGMIDIGAISPNAKESPGRIAIHAHVYYPDLAPEMAGHFACMPFGFDLFVSVPNEAARETCQHTFGGLPRLRQLTVVVAPNRGRDIAPMFCTFGAALSAYDFIAHVHSKKSLYNKGATNGWREYLFDSLFGNQENLLRIFSLMAGEKGAGLVYPQNFSGLPYAANTWLANRNQGQAWCQRLGIEQVPTGYFDFPAGSMFWARTDALRPLFKAGIQLEDFPEEAGQNDGTFAHCLERLLGLVASRSSFSLAILRDVKAPSWSRWHFDQYLGRSREYTEAVVTDPRVQLIIFDIFDTLLLRPLVDPEDLKILIAKRAGGSAGRAYARWRVDSEARARRQAGRDVSLEAIFVEFASLSELPLPEVDTLRRLEEAMEWDAVTPRPEAIWLLRHAVEAGKRVVLASDMYLPRAVIETMLAEHGIDGWHTLYLSSEVGLRKDAGTLYRHIFEREGVTPEHVLVIGDNERSDLQIPGDMGTQCCHVLRPVELARAVPRLGSLVEETIAGNNLDARVALGLIIRDHFHHIFYPHFDPAVLLPMNPRAIGYAVLGPMVLAFSQWLSRRAAEDGVEKLYFLSREGQFLKQAYDRWQASSGDGPQSEYLVLSRRAVTVAMMSNVDDILAIAANTHFRPNDMASFLHVRFGLKLDEAEWNELYRRGLWVKGKMVEISARKIDHMRPLLGALSGRILDHGRTERPGLMAYLRQMGLEEENRCAVVDIGYAGTIQSRLNRLLNRSVDGYYMITDSNAEKVSSEHGVLALGCFGHLLQPKASVPLLLENSFTLEKLLSSDDPQIICYRHHETGEVTAELQLISEDEQRTRHLRAEIRGGAMEFIDKMLAVRDKLYPELVIPVDWAAELFAAFVTNPADAELEILRALVLDDHYCGRGVVS